MLVKAIKMGYYGDKRRREGEVFEMADDIYAPSDRDGKRLVDRNGKERFCSWVEALEGAPVASKGRSPVKPNSKGSNASRNSQAPLSKDSEVI